MTTLGARHEEVKAQRVKQQAQGSPAEPEMQALPRGILKAELCEAQGSSSAGSPPPALRSLGGQPCPVCSRTVGLSRP